jgi:hypothetical protein
MFNIFTTKQNLKQYLIVIAITLATIPFVWFWYDSTFPFKPKRATFVNYYTHPVIVSIDDKEATIQPNHSGMMEVNPRRYSYRIVVRDLAGNTLTTREHDIDREGGYSIDILSENNRVKQCFDSVDVSGLYYSTDTKYPLRMDLDLTQRFYGHETVIEDATNSIYLVPNDFRTLFPGEYNGDKLPQIAYGKGSWAYALVPIDCTNKNDQEAVGESLIYWLKQDGK